MMRTDISNIIPEVRIEQCEKISLPQGSIYLGASTEQESIGYLELHPHTLLTLHNRPAIERLLQIKGKADMIIFRQTRKVITLDEGDYLEIIPPGTWHIHANPYNQVCLQYWDFEGDIREVIGNIRKQAGGK